MHPSISTCSILDYSIDCHASTRSIFVCKPEYIKKFSMLSYFKILSYSCSASLNGLLEVMQVIVGLAILIYTSWFDTYPYGGKPNKSTKAMREEQAWCFYVVQATLSIGCGYMTAAEPEDHIMLTRTYDLSISYDKYYQVLSPHELPSLDQNFYSETLLYRPVKLPSFQIMQCILEELHEWCLLHVSKPMWLPLGSKDIDYIQVLSSCEHKKVWRVVCDLLPHHHLV